MILMKWGCLGLLVVIALELCYIVIHHYIVSSVIFIFIFYMIQMSEVQSWL